MFARKTIAVTSLLALLALFSVLMHSAADAQSRWPPWQSYGEAEDASRKKPVSYTHLTLPTILRV